jgi:hypothetical protein|tara:strand:+ start:2740 stop:3066 length:327 start_codon:yes stop_codon:yes gene_type:complete
METEIERLNKMKEKIIEKSEKRKKKLPTKLKKEPKQDLGDEGYRPMTFTIHPNEAKVLNEWMGNIYGVYGMYGNFEYKFKSGGGLGYDIWVYSDLAKTEICLTKDVDY